MITHHGWRVSARPAMRCRSVPPTAHDDFDVLSAALDCCRVLRDAGRDGIELHVVECIEGAEVLHALDWRKLIAA